MPTEIYNKWCSLLLQYRLAALFLRSPVSQKASSTERPSHEGLALQFDVLKSAQRTCSRQTCICVIESTFQTCTQVSVILVFKQAMHALSIHVIRFHLSDACAANLLTCTKGTQHHNSTLMTTMLHGSDYRSLPCKPLLQLGTFVKHGNGVAKAAMCYEFAEQTTARTLWHAPKSAKI
jgi:hypothetical protein